MRNLIKIALLGLTLITYSCSDKKVSEKPLEEQLKGKVSSLVQFNYSASEKFGEISKDELISKTEEKYDERGNIKESVSTRDGIIKHEEHWEYNDNGKVIKHSDLGDWGLGRIETSKYDNNNNEIERDIEFPGTSSSHKYIARYDANGNRTEFIWYLNGQFDSIYKYKYDENGNNVEESRYEEDGDIMYKNVFKYDSKGNLFEKYAYDSDGKLEEKTVNKYDYRGNLISRVIYDSDTDASFDRRFEYSYDSKCREIGISRFNPNGEITAEETMQYDEHGFVKEEVADDGTKWNYEYPDFDTEGNWLVKKMFKNGKLTRIEERVIGYFDE